MFLLDIKDGTKNGLKFMIFSSQDALMDWKIIGTIEKSQKI